MSRSTTISIEVEESTAELIRALKQRAAAQGRSLDELLMPLVAEVAGIEAEQTPRNEMMLAVLARSSERLKDMPVRGSGERTLRMIREARAGSSGSSKRQHYPS